MNLLKADRTFRWGTDQVLLSFSIRIERKVRVRHLRKVKDGIVWVEHHSPRGLFSHYVVDERLERLGMVGIRLRYSGRRTTTRVGVKDSKENARLHLRREFVHNVHVHRVLERRIVRIPARPRGG